MRGSLVDYPERPDFFMVAEADRMYVLAYWGDIVSIYTEDSRGEYIRTPIASFSVGKINRDDFMHLTDLIATQTIEPRSLRDKKMSAESILAIEMKGKVYGICGKRDE